MAEWWPRAHKLCPFIGFQILSFLKIFVTYFSGTMKAIQLIVCINMDNDNVEIRYEICHACSKPAIWKGAH